MANYKLIKYFLICLVAIVPFSCSKQEPFFKSLEIHDDFFSGTVLIERLVKMGKYRLSILDRTNKRLDKIYTPFEVYAMESGDINHDGRTDICLGIIKPTPFDSTYKKRLFIFQIDQNYIRPLWLGSRLAHTLESFSIQSDEEQKCFVRTIEIIDKNKYCINEYRWESFGLSYVKNVFDNLSIVEAQSLINQKE